LWLFGYAGWKSLLQPEADVSIWIDVYCREQVRNIRTETFLAEIRGRIGLFSYLFAQEDPVDTLSLLRVEKITDSSGSTLLNLHYLQDGPPIVIECVSELERVVGEVEEYLDENFAGREGYQSGQIRKHLDGVLEIFHVCLKQLHADGMGSPLAYAAVSWLAESGGGLIRADGQGWLQLVSSGELTIIEPE
jgi:hypothetical protein